MLQNKIKSSEYDLLEYKISEEQDALILSAIRLVNRKMLDLLAILSHHRISPDWLTPFSKATHSKWAQDLICTLENLKKWELSHSEGQ
jgi:hypothetical protein